MDRPLQPALQLSFEWTFRGRAEPGSKDHVAGLLHVVTDAASLDAPGTSWDSPWQRERQRPARAPLPRKFIILAVKTADKQQVSLQTIDNHVLHVLHSPCEAPNILH